MNKADVVSYLRHYLGKNIKWKNSEHSGYKDFVLKSSKGFSLADSGICCFDFILISAVTVKLITDSELKEIYKEIIKSKFSDATSLIKDDLLLLSRKEFGMPGMGPDVKTDWPEIGDLVFFSRKMNGTKLDHVAVVSGDNKVITFGENVPQIAVQNNLTQKQLNDHGLIITPNEKSMVEVKNLIGGAVYTAEPVWA